MARISPMLSNSLNLSGNIQQTNNQNQNQNNYNNQTKLHEKIYEDLTKRANEVKPNEAKAKLIKEGPVTSVISAIKDTGKDGTNFVKATITGKMGDNSLGRINDLGMKIGAGVIAAFLAAHSKTKTEAIMKFVGGGAFVAAMSIWPKLFINLPARLVHGFRIDQRYISAQGDKKDFFLDNQFLPWDAFSREEMAKNAKNAGIDFDSENGEEKIRRKMQKTALQNRTLWMATAGFATPLMAAHIGNKVEPIIKDAVIKHDFKKAKDVVENSFDEYLNKSKAISNTEAINTAFESYKGENDEAFFKTLGEKLNLNIISEKFRSLDDSKIIKEHTTGNITSAIKGIWEQVPVANIDELKKQLANIELPNTADVESFFSEETTITKLSSEKINEIIDSLGDNVTVGKIKEKLSALNITSEQADKYLEGIKVDSKKFQDAVVSYDKNVIAPIRGRLKAFIDLANTAAGDRTESVYTKSYQDTLNGILKDLGLSRTDLKKVAQSEEECAKVLEQFFSDSGNHGKVKELLNKIAEADLQKDAQKIAQELAKGENIEKILARAELSDEAVKLFSDFDILALDKAIVGEMDSSLSSVIANHLEKQKANINAVLTRPAICANFEARLKSKDGIIVAGKNLAEEGNEELLAAARKLIYRGNISNIENAAGVQKFTFKEIYKAIFNEEAFKDEPEIVKQHVKKLIKQVEDGNMNAAHKYVQNCDLIARVKSQAQNLSNNKAWMKIFGPMALALVGVTLLAQPLFGKINKEFPDENKNGGAK